MNSMTGMGRARGKIGSSFILLEVKSVNHKYCEVHTRLVPRFQTFELDIVQGVKKKISRGKIDVWVGEEKSSGELLLNEKLLKNYYLFLKKIKKTLNLKDPVDLSHIQNGFSYWMTRDIDVKKQGPAIQALLNKALNELIAMRAREGATSKKQIESRIKSLEGLHQKIGSKKGEVVETQKLKLEKRLEKILSGVEVDQGKLANEVAFYADRSDISEELERLASHFSQMKGFCQSAKPSGRSLDFLIQEMNREWNTIASKAQEVSIAHWVVEAKSELEKIREQVQNIE